MTLQELIDWVKKLVVEEKKGGLEIAHLLYKRHVHYDDAAVALEANDFIVSLTTLDNRGTKVLHVNPGPPAKKDPNRSYPDAHQLPCVTWWPKKGYPQATQRSAAV